MSKHKAIIELAEFAAANPSDVTSDEHDLGIALLALKARLDAAHGLLRRWSGGLVPVGDYVLRAETDAALTGEAS